MMSYYNIMTSVWKTGLQVTVAKLFPLLFNTYILHKGAKKTELFSNVSTYMKETL